MLMGLMLFAVITVSFRSGCLEVVRDLPQFVTAGKEFTYGVRCKNKSNLEMSSFLLRDVAVDHRPSREEFLVAREPHEHLRNGFDRLFAYYRWLWLCRMKVSFFTKSEVVTVIESSGVVDLVMDCLPLRRGRLEFSSMKLYLPDPFNLVCKCKLVESEVDYVLVLPRRYKLPEAVWRGVAGDQYGGLLSSGSIGNSGEFVGMRQYRAGDNLRSIDWRAWAKIGEPVVREYEDMFFPRYGLILDTNGSYDSLECFECAISLAASFACSLDTRECLLDFIFMKQGSQILTVGKGVERPERILEHLASVELEVQPDWENLSSHVLRSAEEFSFCIVVFSQFTSERKELLMEWRRAGLSVRALVVVCDDEQNDEIVDAGVTPIRVNDVQRDVYNLL